ncbi:MAG: toll/interleukin-1 receptor domain-containing protein, partial [Candidatus Methanoperedens sp.]|nr:toll/interleukin-1 receptor domain-containing protein [Candidatus Methanoperedens sp.]
MVKIQPIAFLSYVRSDDEHENGRLTQFCERLSAEVKMQTGEEFHIFQDRKDIKWGENWKERIEKTLDGVTFLILIITPSFFTSTACRDEFKRFIEREKKLNRNDLILPVYYVSSPLLDIKEKCAADEIAKIISSRQRVDWREIRFMLPTAPEYGKRLAEIAVQIRESLERVQLKVITPEHKKVEADTDSEMSGSMSG